MNRVPEGFVLTYSWASGTVPPPGHYEVQIHVPATGEGRVELIPDYPGPGVPVWRETFPLTPADRARIYRRLVEARILEAPPRPLPDPPLGGPTESLTVVVGDRRIHVPAGLAPADARRLAPLYALLRGLVPPQVWERLEARRQAYIRRLDR